MSEPQQPAPTHIQTSQRDLEKGGNLQQCSTIQSTMEPAEDSTGERQSPPYHVFSSRKKRLLVFIVSMAGLFSPLSSNIYFPALDDIADVSSRGLEGPIREFTRG